MQKSFDENKKAYSIVVISLQYLRVSNQYVVQLTLTQCHSSIIAQRLNKQKYKLSMKNK